MARPLRYSKSATELRVGRTYHVTNRGVDRCAIFHTDLDRIVFLAMVASACAKTGVICHAFCLMTNHFHMVVEDSRGTLSQFMHGFQGAYAQFFNATRCGGRSGHLWQDRFHSDEIGSRAYFDNACAYVVNNPLRAMPALAASPDAYPWSSGAFALGPSSGSARMYCDDLLDRVGGVDGVLASIAERRCRGSMAGWRRRVEALASGEWIEREHVLDGRLPDEYRRFVASRLGVQSPFTKAPVREGAIEGTASASEDGKAKGSVRDRQCTLPSRRRPFAGVKLGEARVTIESSVIRSAPVSPKAILAYALVRFCSATTAAIARELGITSAGVGKMVNTVRSARTSKPGWSDLLWRIEWAVQWRLLAAPCRP